MVGLVGVVMNELLFNDETLVTSLHFSYGCKSSKRNSGEEESNDCSLEDFFHGWFPFDIVIINHYGQLVNPFGKEFTKL